MPLVHVTLTYWTVLHHVPSDEEVDPGYGVEAPPPRPGRPRPPIARPERPTDPDYGIDLPVAPGQPLPPVGGRPGHLPSLPSPEDIAAIKEKIAEIKAAAREKIEAIKQEIADRIPGMKDKLQAIKEEIQDKIEELRDMLANLPVDPGWGLEEGRPGHLPSPRPPGRPGQLPTRVDIEAIKAKIAEIAELARTKLEALKAEIIARLPEMKEKLEALKAELQAKIDELKDYLEHRPEAPGQPIRPVPPAWPPAGAGPQPK